MNNFTFAAVFIGLIVISLLVTYGVKIQRNNWLLVGSLFCLLYSLFATWLIDTQNIAKVPYLARVGNIFGYMVYPFLYLFARNTFYPGPLLRKIDFLFFLPATFYITDMIPFFILSNDEKVLIVKSNLLNNKNTYNEGWLVHPTFHFGFRTYWSAFIHVLFGILLYKNWRTNQQSLNQNNHNVFRFLLTLAIIFLPLTIVLVYGNLNHPNWWNNSVFTITLGTPLFVSGIYLLFSPNVIYGFNNLNNKNLNNTIESKFINKDESFTSEETSKNKIIETEILAEQIHQLVLFMENEKPFIASNLTINKLAILTNIPVYIISNIINHHFKSNFNTWVNNYRIKYFLTLTNNPELKQFTIEALAMQSGFANRVTFNIAFKREIGESPGKYLKSIKKKYVNDNASYS